MSRLQVRHGTAAQWTAANPVLKNGEPGAETDTKKLKVGDGLTTWNSLAYIGVSSGITELTGDVTAGPGSGSQAATIANNAVTLAKMADIATDSIIGRASNSSGDPEVLTALPFAFTGDVTRAADSNAQTIANSAVTLAKIANASANSKLLGSGSAGSGSPYAELTLGTALSMSGTTLNVSGATAGLDARSSIYPPFTPAGVDAEFTGSDLAGFTLVNDGGATLATNTESNDMLSIKFPGSDTAGHLQAYMKAATVNVGDVIDICFNGAGLTANFHMFGLIMANGATYGAGAQVVYAFLPNSTTQNCQLWANTNYNTQGTNSTFNGSLLSQAAKFMRLKYEAANSFSGWISPDGISWANITGALARTLTPTHVGFFGTSGGATGQYVWNVRFFRKTT